MDCTELLVLDAVTNSRQQGGHDLKLFCCLVHGDGVLVECCDEPISFEEAGYACLPT